MDPWRTLKEAIPDGKVRAINKHMRVSYDYVLKWRREPLSSEKPDGTGMLSPLDRVLELIDAVFLHNPQGASLIVDHVVIHHEQLINTHRVKPFNGDDAERSRASCELLHKATNAVCALNADTIGPETVRELSRLLDAANVLLQRVGKELYFHPETNNSTITNRSN